MDLKKKLKNKHGFTLTEVLVVVAVIALLAGIAFAFVNPKKMTYKENNVNAEAIAVAAQNRLTEIRNTGNMKKLREIGEPASSMGGPSGAVSVVDAAGGYRYLFNYIETDGAVSRNPDVEYILPFGAIDSELAQNYFAIGYQSDTGMVGEVFYSEKPFGSRSADYLIGLQGSAEKRKTENVGYYQGTVDDREVAFANLPTPQITVTNYEELTLRIYLPEVRQLEESGKRLGILVSLSDKGGNAYKAGLTLAQTAIYSTYSLGTASSGFGEETVVIPQDISSGATYTMVLDTVKPCESTSMQASLGTSYLSPPRGVFEDWAVKSQAMRDGYFLLGDNAVITVTVYCLYGTGEGDFPVDPTFMPRSASVTFNGWFNDYREWYDDGDKEYYATVDIACGRHLQNLGKISEIRESLKNVLPDYKYENGTYIYSNYNRGRAKAYTDGSSYAKPPISSTDIDEKYTRRSVVDPKITYANQVNTIDFDCDEWKDDGKKIPFTPVNLPDDFEYYGNYLSISHLYVDAPFYAGLFGYVYDARLYDILLINPSVTSHMPWQLAEIYEMGVGALVGTSRDSDYINNCQVAMMQENGSYLPEEYRVQGEGYVGGLIGFCEDEHIKNCSASVYTGYAEGAMKADGVTPLTSLYVGGLIGCITGDSSLGSCYAAGNLSGEYVGGLVGYITEDSDPSGDDYRIESCYTAGHIEYAAKSASGIIGNIRERMGVAKSAFSVYGNYCAIVYGKKIGSDYVWTSRLADGSPVPIYGTFRGDNFEWLRTESLGFSNTYLKGKYADIHYYFGGAVFANDNKNYYIAQRGIEYSNSPYFEAIADTVKQLADKIAAASSSAALSAQVETARNKVYWLKKLQALEEVKEFVEAVIRQTENEPGTAFDGLSYSLAGNQLYIDRVRSRIYLGVDSDNDDKNSPRVSLVQALHAIYDGNYTDADGVKHTNEKLTYEGGTNELKNSVTGIPSYTFMSFYGELKQAYKDLADDSTANDAAALRKVLLIVGDDSANAAGDIQGTFYMNGLFYKIFVKSLFCSAYDKTKDYYQNHGDLDGEIMYRYYRGDVVGDDGSSGRLKRLIAELGISKKGRAEFLAELKKANLQEAIDVLKDYPAIIDKWSGGMSSYKSTAKTLANTVNTELGDLMTAIDTYAVGSAALDNAVQEAYDAMYNLWEFFEDHKNTTDVVDLSDNVKNMRSLRDPIQSYYLKYVALCGASSESGVDLALTELGEKLKETNADRTALAREFAEKFALYYGADSGHKIVNTPGTHDASQKLLDFMIEYSLTKLAEHKDWEGDPDYGFMYDYGKHYSTTYNPNPYEKKLPEGSYVNGDTGVYNNVFPYLEGQYTKYYPFPFVFGRKVEAEQGDRFRALFVLFHYGDWLTEDLWATEGETVSDPVATVLNAASSQMSEIYQGLQSINTTGSGSVGSLKKYVEPLSDSVAACEAQVESAAALQDKAQQSARLGEIQSTVSGWLGEGGLFKNLLDECNKHATKGDIPADILPRLQGYRDQLNALLNEIKRILS